MNLILASIEAEYRRYKALAEAAMAQLTEAELNEPGLNGGNPITVITRHIAGNLRSRFTDFLDSDGEKEWRNREQEFSRKKRTRQELTEHWEAGWKTLFDCLSELTDEHLHSKVVIRGTELTVSEALHRSLAHTSYHVGQVVYLAKSIRGTEWRYLSIPPGESERYNQAPSSERAASHTAALKELNSPGEKPNPRERKE